MERSSEWSKARESPSALVPNALEQIDAAIWLIAGGRYSQAITTLHTAIELLLKSELEKFHPLLIADRIDYRLLKGLLEGELRRHPQFQSLSAGPLDFDKTITFTEALARIAEIHPDLKVLDSGLKQLQSIRNKIIHRRDAGDHDEYVYRICVTALPFLEMFALRSAQIDLEKLLGPDVYREIKVARRLCEELQRSGQTTYGHALKTVRTVMLYRNVDFPAPTDEDGWHVDESDRLFQTGESLKSELSSRWSGELVEVSCKICGSIYAYAGIEEVEGDNLADTEPHSVACAECGLFIERDDIGLAAAHFGSIPAELIAKSLDD
jgi:hypothetical protein